MDWRICCPAALAVYLPSLPAVIVVSVVSMGKMTTCSRLLISVSEIIRLEISPVEFVP